MEQEHFYPCHSTKMIHDWTAFIEKWVHQRNQLINYVRAFTLLEIDFTMGESSGEMSIAKYLYIRPILFSNNNDEDRGSCQTNRWICKWIHRHNGRGARKLTATTKGLSWLFPLLSLLYHSWWQHLSSVLIAPLRTSTSREKREVEE